MLQGLYRHCQDEFAKHLRIPRIGGAYVLYFKWKAVLICAMNSLLTGRTVGGEGYTKIVVNLHKFSTFRSFIRR